MDVEVGTIIRITVFRGRKLSEPLWAYTQSDDARWRLVTFVCGSLAEAFDTAGFDADSDISPNTGWYIDSYSAQDEHHPDKWEPVDSADVPDHVHVAIAKLALLGRTN